MSQSVLLTQALKAVERVLEADSSDLKQLAEIAGVDPAKLFFRADLNGLNLTATDVGFLLPLETQYEGAILTEEQRRSFRKENRKQAKRQVRKKIVDLRAYAVAEYIERFGNENKIFYAVQGGEVVSAELLRELLLDPFKHSTHNAPLVNADYTNLALSKLVPWVSGRNISFFQGLFSLLGRIMSPVDLRTSKLVGEFYFPILGEDVGDLVSRMHPTGQLDYFWLTIDGSNGVLKRAKELGNQRMVNVGAIESSISGLGWEELLSLFSSVPFECDGDQAERLSINLINMDWPATATNRILASKTQPKVRNALFRQLFGQGIQERVVQGVRWLDSNTGAAGALSLENAFANIQDFKLAIRLVTDLAPNWTPLQIAAVIKPLKALAESRNDHGKLDKLANRYNASIQ